MFVGAGIKVPVATAAAAYSSGDVVGALMKLEGIVPDSGGCIKVPSIVVSDAAKQTLALDVLFFDKAITLPADNAAFDLSAADALNFIGAVSFLATDYITGTNRSFATKFNIWLLLQARKATKGIQNNVSNKDLWCAVVTRGAPTYTANCLQLIIGLEAQR